MKKLVLGVSILLFGFCNAKIVYNGEINLEKEVVTTKNIKPLISIKKDIIVKTKPQNWYAETSCGFVAVTYQDWTPQQASEWFDKIEKYYCKPPVHSGPATYLADS